MTVLESQSALEKFQSHRILEGNIARSLRDLARIHEQRMRASMAFREGDLVTITDKNDVAKALEECIQTAEKLAGSNARPAGASFQQFLPPLRLQLVPVGDGVPSPSPRC